MSTIAEKQAVLIEEFEFFDEWMDKYNHIIEMGKAMPVLNAVDKNDDLLVQGCQSKVWLKAEKKGEYVRFFADADAIISRPSVGGSPVEGATGSRGPGWPRVGRHGGAQVRLRRPAIGRSARSATPLPRRCWKRRAPGALP